MSIVTTDPDAECRRALARYVARDRYAASLPVGDPGRPGALTEADAARAEAERLMMWRGDALPVRLGDRIWFLDSALDLCRASSNGGRVIR